MDSPKPHLPQADFRGVSLLSLVIWGFITSNANRARLSTTKRRTGSGAQLEVSLHADAIHANLYCTYDAEVLGVFGEHRREHARDNISNLPVSSNGCLRQRVPYRITAPPDDCFGPDAGLPVVLAGSTGVATRAHAALLMELSVM